MIFFTYDLIPTLSLGENTVFARKGHGIPAVTIP